MAYPKRKRKKGGVKNGGGSRDSWPCPKNNKMLSWRQCRLINRVLPGRFYGGYDCWTCPNLITLLRQVHKHKKETLFGVIAALVILCLTGAIVYVWLARRSM